MQVTEHALKIQIQKRHHDKHEQATPQNGIKEGNQGKWLMGGGASRCLWQLQVAAVLLCKLAGAYLPHTIVHITYSLRCHLGGQRPHLGRRAFGAVGRHISIDWWQHLPSANQPPTCPPTTATQQLRCTNCQGVEDTKYMIAYLWKH